MGEVFNSKGRRLYSGWLRTLEREPEMLRDLSSLISKLLSALSRSSLEVCRER